jgi:hypothetical protein
MSEWDASCWCVHTNNTGNFTKYWLGDMRTNTSVLELSRIHTLSRSLALKHSRLSSETPTPTDAPTHAHPRTPRTLIHSHSHIPSLSLFLSRRNILPIEEAQSATINSKVVCALATTRESESLIRRMSISRTLSNLSSSRISLTNEVRLIETVSRTAALEKDAREHTPSRVNKDTNSNHQNKKQMQIRWGCVMNFETGWRESTERTPNKSRPGLE